MLSFLDTVQTQRGKINKGLGYERSDGYAETWRFGIGERVTHRDQPSMLSEVLYRSKTRGGLEIYGVRRQEECEVRDLMFLGEVLVAA